VNRILVLQTAFPGDVVLILPLVQALREHVPAAEIACLTTPRAADLLAHHPAIDERIMYDKRGKDRGVGGFIRMVRRLRTRPFDLALIPHRSLRSAALCRLAAIPRRIGFSTSAGRLLLTDVVAYDPHAHEIRRNLQLLTPLGVPVAETLRPRLFPGDAERREAGLILDGLSAGPGMVVALAPGSVWATKRWPEEKYAELGRRLTGRGDAVVLVGGPEDEALCARIARAVGGDRIRSAAGRLSLLGSAALLARCEVLVSNDSAPMHLAGAVGTRVVAVFGPTVPAFGFAPSGPRDIVVETHGLLCRPCAIHGGPRCPIGTFVCMLNIEPQAVLNALDDRGVGEGGG
jgi:heptosyltransferase-2